MFEFVKERCRLAHVNVRSEMHGDEKKTAYDIKFEVSLANAVLIKFHPELRDAFYKGDDNHDMLNPDFKPQLKFPLMGMVSWELEIPRTLLRIHDCDDEYNDIVLGGGKTNKFKLELMEGGTVKMTFRCQFSEAEEEDIAKLLRVMDQTVPISLQCAAEEEKEDNFEQAESLSREPMSEARQEAESLFGMAPHDKAPDPDLPEAESNVAPISGAKRGKRAGGMQVE